MLLQLPQSANDVCQSSRFFRIFFPAENGRHSSEIRSQRHPCLSTSWLLDVKSSCKLALASPPRAVSPLVEACYLCRRFYLDLVRRENANLCKCAWIQEILCVSKAACSAVNRASADLRCWKPGPARLSFACVQRHFDRTTRPEVGFPLH